MSTTNLHACAAALSRAQRALDDALLAAAGDEVTYLPLLDLWCQLRTQQIDLNHTLEAQQRRQLDNLRRAGL